MGGWIRIHRDILKWEWFDDEKMFKFFISLILLANHEDLKWHGITVSRGQFISSREKLSALLNFTEQQVRTMLTKLKNTEEITIKTTNKYTIITICNYDKYQTYTDNNQPAIQPTNNQQITNNQPTNNQQITTNNNYKNDNNEKNDKNGVVRFTPPTTEEVKAYCEERKNKVDAQRFVDFYTTKGWMVGKSKMKDWKAAVRTWEKTERPAPAKYQETLNVNKFWNIKK